MRATLAIHGIWTKARDVSWVEEFENYADGELDVRPRIIGWISGVLSYFKWYRDRIVSAEAAYVGRLSEPPNVIAHSFGGYITWSLMAERGVKFNNIILLAPAAPVTTEWKRLENRFSRARVYWSLKDEIIGFAKYGKMGKFGPTFRHDRVESIETNLLHSDHVRTDKFREYIEFLKQ